MHLFQQCRDDYRQDQHPTRMVEDIRFWTPNIERNTMCRLGNVSPLDNALIIYPIRFLTMAYDPLWDELQRFLDEQSVVNDRRPGEMYMPFAMSVQDLISQLETSLEDLAIGLIGDCQKEEQ